MSYKRYLQLRLMYMTILDEPGITVAGLAQRCGFKKSSQAEWSLPLVEKQFGLLYEDENGGLYAV